MSIPLLLLLACCTPLLSHAHPPAPQASQQHSHTTTTKTPHLRRKSLSIRKIQTNPSHHSKARQLRWPSLAPLQAPFSLASTVAQDHVSPKRRSHRTRCRSRSCKTTKTPKVRHKRGNWFHPTYLIDWGIALGLGVGGAIAFELIPPVSREWLPADKTLSATYRPDSFPMPLTLALSGGIPLVGFALAQIGVRQWQDFHHAALGLTESLGLTIALTGAINTLVGRLRPDWRDRCIPDIESLACTGNAALVLDGRRSFPSRQTAYAFAGGTFLALYLWGKLRPLERGNFWAIPIVLAPLTGATLLGISRVLDNRNHWEDVLAGAMLGAACAFLTYHLNFHGLFGPKAGTPKTRTQFTFAPLLSPTSIGIALSGQWP